MITSGYKRTIYACYYTFQPVKYYIMNLVHSFFLFLFLFKLFLLLFLYKVCWNFKYLLAGYLFDQGGRQIDRQYTYLRQPMVRSMMTSTPWGVNKTLRKISMGARHRDTGRGNLKYPSYKIHVLLTAISFLFSSWLFFFFFGGGRVLFLSLWEIPTIFPGESQVQKYRATPSLVEAPHNFAGENFLLFFPLLWALPFARHTVPQCFVSAGN